MDGMTQQALELRYPDKKVWAEWYQLFSCRNKSELENMAAPLRLLLRDKNVTAIDEEGNRRVPTEVSSFLNCKGNVRKDVLMDFLCFMLGDVHNFSHYINNLSEADRKVWETALLQFYVNVDEIHRLTGVHWFPKGKDGFCRHYYAPSEISDKLAWFSLVEGKGPNLEGRWFWRRDVYCRLIENLHASLLPLFFPEACDVKKQLLDELPAEASLRTFSGEADMLLCFSSLNGLYETRQLDFPKTKFSQSALRKLAQAVSLREFFPQHKVKEMALFRCSIVMNLYVAVRASEDLPERAEEALKELFNRIMYYPSILVPVLLPHVTGLRKNELYESYGTQLGFALLSLLEALPRNKWISATGIHFKLMQAAIHYAPLFPAYVFDRMEVYNEKLQHVVFLDRLYRELSVPFINGLLFAMAAFGLLDVAYSEEEKADAVSYVDSLAYVRLTPLGAFVLGLTREYTPADAGPDQESLFELDGQHRIVRSLATPNPYLSLLVELAVPIGGNRYRVTADSFLCNCQGSKNIEERIALFKRYICREPSAEWNEFFETLLRQSRSVTRVDEFKYLLYHIAPEDKELQRIVSTDPVIRQYSLRAEGYLWLIEADKLKTIQKRLKECGYLF